jgi:hypothetical protein
MDTNGFVIWEAALGGAEWDCGNSIQQVNETEYVIVGTTQSYDVTNGNVFLLKISVVK